MKNRILQLCRRLNKFTLDEIATISEIEPENLKRILDELIAENKIIYNDNSYQYSKQDSVKKQYFVFQYYNPAIIDFVIKFFCSEVPAYKTSQILGIGNRQAIQFYDILRSLIYDRQENILKSYFQNNPQERRSGTFFDTEIYFYTYGDKIFVSENVLKDKNLSKISLKEKQEFKKIYCYLRRNIEAHNKNKKLLSQKIAELIWRRNKDYKTLYDDLKNLLCL